MCDRAEGSAAEVQRLIKFRLCRIDGLWAAECRLFQPTLWGGELIRCRKGWKRCLVSMSACVMCCCIRTFEECGSNCILACWPPGQDNSVHSEGEDKGLPEEKPVLLGHHACAIQRWRDKDTKHERARKRGRRRRRIESELGQARIRLLPES